MDQNRLTGLGFVLLGLSQMSSILIAGGTGNTGIFTFLMAIGGFSLASIGAWILYQGDTSEVWSEPSHRAMTVAVLAAVSLFIGGFAYAFIG